MSIKYETRTEPSSPTKTRWALTVTLTAALAVSAIHAQTDFAVVRLTPSGTLDTSFSGDGRASIDFGIGASFDYCLDSLSIRAVACYLLAGRRPAAAMTTSPSCG